MPYMQGPLVLPQGWKLSYRLTRVTPDPGNDKMWRMDLGNTGLMLNVITPLQKYLNSGITVVDVLAQRFRDLFQFEVSDEFLNQIESVFNRKEVKLLPMSLAKPCWPLPFPQDRAILQRVRILIEVFDVPGELQIGQPVQLIFRSSVMSDTITNSKSKECGPLRLYDINPSISCCKGGVRVHILSYFKLSSDVKARFIVVDDKEKITRVPPDILKQPDPAKCNLFNQFVIMFDSPQQDWKLIKEHIYDKGHHIRLTALRTSDSRLSNTSFRFDYKMHHWTPEMDISPPAPLQGTLTLSAISKTNSASDNITTDRLCVMCNLLQIKEVRDPSLPNARPGIKRRDQESYPVFNIETDEVSTAKRPKPEAPVVKPAPMLSIVPPDVMPKKASEPLVLPLPQIPAFQWPLTPLPKEMIDVQNNIRVVKKEPEEILANPPHIIKTEPMECVQTIIEEPSNSSLHLTIPVPPTPPTPRLGLKLTLTRNIEWTVSVLRVCSFNNENENISRTLTCCLAQFCWRQLQCFLWSWGQILTLGPRSRRTKPYLS